MNKKIFEMVYKTNLFILNLFFIFLHFLFLFYFSSLCYFPYIFPQTFRNQT